MLFWFSEGAPGVAGIAVAAFDEDDISTSLRVKCESLRALDGTTVWRRRFLGEIRESRPC